MPSPRYYYCKMSSTDIKPYMFDIKVIINGRHLTDLYKMFVIVRTLYGLVYVVTRIPRLQER